MNAPSRWTPAKRALVKSRIDRAAKKAAREIGAHTVLIIACFTDGEYYHTQDGGTSPMPEVDLYKMMITAKAALDESSGDDVAVN